MQPKALKQLSPASLLTTRRRSAIALAFTAFVLVLAVRSVRADHAESGWFLGAPLLHGWLLSAVNIFIYLYLCWLGFWFIRGTAGRERLFMVGCFADILPWPLKMLRPQWATATKLIGAFGLVVALLAALALLLEPSAVSGDGPN